MKLAHLCSVRFQSMLRLGPFWKQTLPYPIIEVIIVILFFNYSMENSPENLILFSLTYCIEITGIYEGTKQGMRVVHSNFIKRSFQQSLIKILVQVSRI